MIEVRIRDKEEARAVNLCEIPLADLGDVVAALREHGVTSPEGDALSDEDSRFIVDHEQGEAYFEIILSGES